MEKQEVQNETKIINVALFENRHNWPVYVTSFLYGEKQMYDPRDFKTFEGLATIKFLKWKSEGIAVVNLYLSGYIGATIAALNAAHSVGLYVKLFHYSNLTNKWIPQVLDFFSPPPGIILKTGEELEIEKEEASVKNSISERERRIIVSYVNILNKLLHHYDPDRFTWEDIYSYIMREYIGVEKEFILLMKPYFINYNKEERDDTPYGERLRKLLDARKEYIRNIKIPYTYNQFSNTRKSRRIINTN